MPAAARHVGTGTAFRSPLDVCDGLPPAGNRGLLRSSRVGMMWTAVAIGQGELARLCKSANPFEDLDAVPKDRCCELEKAWDAAHWLIGGGSEGGDDVARFIEMGGHEVPELDAGYGPARFFEPEAVSSIRQGVSGWTRSRLMERWASEKAELKELYPFAGGGRDLDEDDREYVLTRFERLREFLARIDAQNLGLLVLLC